MLIVKKSGTKKTSPLMNSPIRGKHDLVQKASLSLNRLHCAMHGYTDAAKSLAYKALA